VPNSFADLFVYLQRLMLDNSSVFEAAANRIYATFAVILIALTGLQMALRRHFDESRFIDVFLRISLGFLMIKFYSVPIPGLGTSFVGLITSYGHSLANELDASMVSKIMERLNALYASLPTPGLTAVLNVFEVFRWIVTILLIACVQVAVFFFATYGYVATSIFVLLGPIAVPWFLFPGMKWIFDGWFRSLIQYSMYAVFAQAFLFVYGNLLINFVDRAGTDFPDGSVAVLFGPLVFYLVIMVGGAMSIGSLCNHFFSGRSGDTGIPMRIF
jgi:hypothetical protein